MTPRVLQVRLRAGSSARSTSKPRARRPVRSGALAGPGDAEPPVHADPVLREDPAVVAHDEELQLVLDLRGVVADDLAVAPHALGHLDPDRQPGGDVAVPVDQGDRLAHEVRLFVQQLDPGGCGLGCGPGRLDQPLQVRHRVALHQVVVDALFLAPLAGGQVDRRHVRALPLQDLDQPLERRLHGGLGHHVRVVDDPHVAVPPHDVVEVGEDRAAAERIAALEVPHAEQCDGGQAVRCERIGLLLPLRDPQGRAGVAHDGLACGRAIDAHGRALGKLVLDRLAGVRAVRKFLRPVLDDAWVVGSKDVEGLPAIGGIDREQQAREVALAVRKTEGLQFSPFGHGAIAPGGDHGVGQAGPLAVASRDVERIAQTAFGC